MSKQFKVGLIFIIGIIMAGITVGIVHSAATDPVTQTFAVTSAATATPGFNTTTLTLGTPGHYKASLTGISVSSSIPETPVPTVYTTTDRHLVVNGLVAASTRTITVHYEKDATLDFTGLSALLYIFPVAAIGYVLYKVWQNHNKTS